MLATLLPQEFRIDKWGKARQYETSGRPSQVKTELAKWLKANGKSRKEFALELDVSLGYVNQLCSGARVPGRDTINQIARLTNNQVNWTHWPNISE